MSLYTLLVVWTEGSHVKKEHTFVLFKNFLFKLLLSVKKKKKFVIVFVHFVQVSSSPRDQSCMKSNKVFKSTATCFSVLFRSPWFAWRRQWESGDSSFWWLSKSAEVQSACCPREVEKPCGQSRPKPTSLSCLSYQPVRTVMLACHASHSSLSGQSY